MNELDVVAGFRADVPPPDPATLARARAGMFAEPGKRSPHRMAARLAPIGALAAVVAVAALLHGLPLHKSPAATSSHPEAVKTLLLAAEVAGQPLIPAPRGDQFMYVRTTWVQPAVNTGTVSQITTDDQLWLSVDRKKAGRHQQKTTPVSVATPSTSSLPICRRCTDLPADLERMRDVLYARATGPGRDFGALAEAGRLLSTDYLPPAQLEALFDAIATIPGVTLVPDAVDAAGRLGEAVAVSYDGRRTELILDKLTHRYLGQTQVTAAGVIDVSTAQITTGVVDKVGQVP